MYAFPVVFLAQRISRMCKFVYCRTDNRPNKSVWDLEWVDIYKCMYVCCSYDTPAHTFTLHKSFVVPVLWAPPAGHPAHPGVSVWVVRVLVLTTTLGNSLHTRTLTARHYYPLPSYSHISARYSTLLLSSSSWYYSGFELFKIVSCRYTLLGVLLRNIHKTANRWE